MVGWYSTGPKIRACDLDIHALVTGYCPSPVMVIIDVAPQELGLPVHAYTAVEEVTSDSSGKSRTVFAHLPSEVGAYEAEEIGVEHLLRDVKDATISTLATRVADKLAALKSLEERLREIRCYLDHVLAGRLPVNHDIMAHLQDVFNLLPNLGVGHLVRAFTVKTNDMLLVMYVASVTRAVTAVHNLITNLAANKERERLADAEEHGAAGMSAPPLVTGA